MPKTIAILHALDANDSHVAILLKKLGYFMERMNIYPDEIRVNDVPYIGANNPGNDKIPSTLVIGWGLSEKPRWTRWSYEIKTSSVIKIFIAVDLFEQYGTKGRVLIMPNVKGGYWRHKSWQTRCKLFLNGCYISYSVPYGMKRIPKAIYNDGLIFSDCYRLVPGSKQEIDIVRLIFNLFVNHDYTMTEISNLLNAQGIKAPNRGKTWSGKKIKSMVTSAFYIGSNQYGACVKHNVFPGLIDRQTFCTAQAKIFGKEAFASVKI
jgi:hypothetical protein